MTQPETLAGQPILRRDVEDQLEQAVRQQIGQRDFAHWFEGKTALTVSANVLVVGVGSPFLLNWMQKRFRRTLATVAADRLGPSGQVRFEVDGRLALAPDHGNPRAAIRRQATATASDNAVPDRSQAQRARSYARLDEFVCGPSNELALAAARHVCDAPGDSFNPLYIHGGVGVGKTHLLESIYSSLRRNFPALRVALLTSEAFTNYFTEALRAKTLPGFRQRFRTVDVLLLDDVDFLNGKRVVQEEFLHTVQQLEAHGRQIVVTADRHPRLLTKLSDELTTRFLSGLVCRIEPPGEQLRREFVTRRAARLKLEATPAALNFVAATFRSNMRELAGALNCLHTYQRLGKRPVGVGAARKLLADLERDCIRIVRIADVEQAVCRLFGVEPDDLKSNRRTRSISQPRMLAMYLARKHTQAAYSEIGEYFGGRNHSTVMAAEKKVSQWVSEQAEVRVASCVWSLGDLVESLEHQLLAG